MFLGDVNSFSAIQQMCLVVAMFLRKQQICFLRWIGVWADVCREPLRVVLHSTGKGWWWGGWWNCSSPHPDFRLLCSYGVSSLSLFAVVVLYFPCGWNQSRQKLPALVPTKGAENHFCFLLLDCEDAVGLFGPSFLNNGTKCSLSPSASYNLGITAAASEEKFVRGLVCW